MQMKNCEQLKCEQSCAI